MGFNGGRSSGFDGGCSNNSVGWLVQKGGLGGGFFYFFNLVVFQCCEGLMEEDGGEEWLCGFDGGREGRQRQRRKVTGGFNGGREGKKRWERRERIELFILFNSVFYIILINCM